MNKYHVGLWVVNEGDIPDVFVRVQTNVVPELRDLVIMAFLLSSRGWARKVEVEFPGFVVCTCLDVVWNGETLLYRGGCSYETV